MLRNTALQGRSVYWVTLAGTDNERDLVAHEVDWCIVYLGAAKGEAGRSDHLHFPRVAPVLFLLVFIAFHPFRLSDRVFLVKLQTGYNSSMALYRSKLGPVGGAGEGGSRDGDIVVDLDPLSAFALMGGGGGAEADTNVSVPASNSRGAEHGLVPGGGATRPEKEQSAPPVSTRPGAAAADKTLDLGSWHMTDLTPAAPPWQVCVLSVYAVYACCLLALYSVCSLVLCAGAQRTTEIECSLMSCTQDRINRQ